MKLNIRETTKALYVHRNTIQNKLNRIREITGLPLDKLSLDFRLLLSCQIILYYRDCLGNMI